MELATFIPLYFGTGALVIGVLLFGEAPLFERTPISAAHWALTRGWVDAVEWGVRKVGGGPADEMRTGVRARCRQRGAAFGNVPLHS
jgi:hypothetical protein